MKKLLFFACLLTLVSFKIADTTLTAEERKFAMDDLNKSREVFLKSIKGLSKEQLNFKSSPTSWSIAECAEHISLAEGNIWGMVDGALKQPADPAKRSEIKVTDADLLKMITDRTNKVKTTEPFEPKGATLEESVKRFTNMRNAHIDYVKNTNDDLRDRYAQLPFGTIDAYQTILFMSGHTARHTAQIEEVKTNPNYPKK
jgi:hypothetical protein